MTPRGLMRNDIHPGYLHPHQGMMGREGWGGIGESSDDDEHWPGS